MKKSESNLNRNLSQPNFMLSTPKGTRYSEAIYCPGKIDEDYLVASYDFQQFKSYILDQIKSQNREILKINKALLIRDQLDSEFFEFKEDISLAVESIEKRFISEVRRVEGNQLSFVTFEKLFNTEEKLRTINSDNISKLELNFREIKQMILSFHEIVSKENEDLFKDLKKKFVSIDDLRKIRDSLVNDVREIEHSKTDKYEDIEGKIEDLQKTFAVRLEEDRQKIVLQVDKKIKNFSESLNLFNSKLGEINEEFHKKIENVKNLIEENSRETLQIVKDQNRFSNIQDELKSLKDRLVKLPNFEEFSKRNELVELAQSLTESQQNISLSARQEIKKLADSKPNLYEYVKKNDLEEASNNLMKKIEMLKMASAGKGEIEKIKKSLQSFCLQEEFLKLKEGILETKRDKESLLEKLFSLENRVKIAEEKNLNLPKFEEKKVKKVPPSLAENGSKELETASVTKRGPTQTDFHLDNFISKLFEEFVKSEIEFGVNSVKRRGKNPVPALKFTKFTDSRPETPDDLNEAVILNTDLTNKSDSEDSKFS